MQTPKREVSHIVAAPEGFDENTGTVPMPPYEQFLGDGARLMTNKEGEPELQMTNIMLWAADQIGIQCPSGLGKPRRLRVACLIVKKTTWLADDDYCWMCADFHCAEPFWEMSAVLPHKVEPLGGGDPTCDRCVQGDHWQEYVLNAWHDAIEASTGRVPDGWDDLYPPVYDVTPNPTRGERK